MCGSIRYDPDGVTLIDGGVRRDLVLRAAAMEARPAVGRRAKRQASRVRRAAGIYRAGRAIECGAARRRDRHAGRMEGLARDWDPAR